MNVRVGDVDLRLFLPSGNWDYLYPPASGEVAAEVTFDYCKTPLEYKEPVFDPDINKLTMYFQIDIDERPLSNEDELRGNVAFLVGIISKRFWFIRAAGFIYKDKGIVLIGKSGSGKSTLVSLFEEALVIDDDLLFTDGSIMRRVSNIGTKLSLTNNSIERLHDDIEEHMIDYIFLLDNQKHPDYSKSINQRTIPHELTFDDRLPESFFLCYSKKPPVPVSCPVFEIGTKSQPSVSKEMIEAIVSPPPPLDIPLPASPQF